MTAHRQWRTTPSPRLMREALEALLGRADGRCERFTTGIGACFEHGDTADAAYGCDQACAACVASFALAAADGDELPRGAGRHSQPETLAGVGTPEAVGHDAPAAASGDADVLGLGGGGR